LGSDSTRRRYRFFNTYEPVVPLYRDVPPLLAAAGAGVELVVSKAEYRGGRGLGDFVASHPGIALKRTSTLGAATARGNWSKTWVSLAYMGSAGLYGLLGPGVSCNVFLTQPPFFNVAGRILSRLRGQHYVCVCMDLQPDLMVACGLMRPKSGSTQVLGWLTRRALHGADAVIVIGRCMQKHVESFGVAGERIHLIRNWADERRIVPLGHSDNPFRQRQQWRDDFVVMYAGNLGIPQCFDAFMGAAQRLQDRDSIRFVILGGGVREAHLKEKAEASALENVEFYPFLHTHYSLSEIYGAADVHFVSLIDACVGLAVPSKPYSIMAAARPILFRGAPGCETARIVREEGIGSVVEDDAGRLAEVILQYAESPGRRREEGRRARALSEGRYSRANGMRQYMEVLQRV